MYVGFNANDTIAVFNNITEKNSAIGNTFKRYDDYIMLRRQSTN